MYPQRMPHGLAYFYLTVALLLHGRTVHARTTAWQDGTHFLYSHESNKLHTFPIIVCNAHYTTHYIIPYITVFLAKLMHVDANHHGNGLSFQCSSAIHP